MLAGISATSGFDGVDDVDDVHLSVVNFDDNDDDASLFAFC